MTSLFYRVSFVCLIVASAFSGFSQSVDFGIEVQQNYNSVEKIEALDKYHPDNLALSVTDLNNDTTNIYFSKFNMENNIEIPLYLRFNWRKRWFVDAKVSHSAYRLSMEGVANYNDQYYYDNYGTYDDFIVDANASGFMDADTADYNSYLNAAKELNESEIRTIEDFRLLALTANVGFRFMPHKSIKFYIASGFTVKQKFRKHLYNHIDFSNPFIHDMRTINSGLDWYAERSTYFNFSAGIEFYRFRATAYVQTMFAYTFPTVQPAQEVVYKSESTAFDVSSSYGFSLSANLFSLDVGKRVHKNDVSSDEVIISNIKKEKDKFDIGARYDHRMFNDMSTYYDLPENRLTILDVDTVLFNDQGTFHEALDMEMIQLGDIKRIDWKGRISGFIDIYFTKRLGARASLGGSQLIYDIEATQLKATAIDRDTLGLQYFFGNNTPQLSYAVYRKKVNVIDLNADVTYKVINKDLFSVTLWAGLGITGLAYSELNKRGKPKGVNELDVYTTFDDWYSSFDTLDMDIHQGDFNMNLNDSPEELMNKLEQTSSDIELNPKSKRLIFPSFRIGVDANIERFIVGFGFDTSLGGMDQFLLRNYSTIYMSIGYKLWKR